MTKNACNLICWAVCGFQDVMKQQEIRSNEGKTKKKLTAKETEDTTTKTVTILWHLLLAILFTTKSGLFKDVCRFWTHQLRLQSKKPKT